MGLIVVAMEVLFSIVLAACMNARVVKTPTPVWYDCCDPGLDRDTKEMCDLAAKRPGHVLRGKDGVERRFIWSDCEEGKERWRD